MKTALLAVGAIVGSGLLASAVGLVVLVLSPNPSRPPTQTSQPATQVSFAPPETPADRLAAWTREQTIIQVDRDLAGTKVMVRESSDEATRLAIARCLCEGKKDATVWVMAPDGYLIGEYLSSTDTLKAYTPTRPLPRKVEPPAPSPPKPAIDKSESMQAQRLEFIKSKLLATGIIKSCAPGEYATRVVVGDAFILADFKDKQAILGAIYSYYWDGFKRHYMVHALDPRTNKTLGTFTREAGLEWN